MKKFTRILAIVLALATIFGFAACNNKDGGEKKMKVGFIFLHDENSTYDKNFITAAEEACKELGVEIIKKTGISETASMRRPTLPSRAAPLFLPTASATRAS